VKGYSLIELLFVIAILGIVVTMGAVNFGSAKAKYDLHSRSSMLINVFQKYKSLAMLHNKKAEISFGDEGIKFLMRLTDQPDIEEVVKYDYDNIKLTRVFAVVDIDEFLVESFPNIPPEDKIYIRPDGFLDHNHAGSFGIEVTKGSYKDMCIFVSTGLYLRYYHDAIHDEWILL